MLTRLHACCALRALLNASATSTGVDCGMCASGAPLSGVSTGTVWPLEATMPPGQVVDVVGLERVRRPRVVLGIGRPLDQRSACGMSERSWTERRAA